ncbi:MAG: indole-3-glycerol phosphate synthase TrpC [Gemmatimonadaceae bacterium]
MPNSHVSRTAPEAQQESFWSEPGGTLGELVRLATARVDALLPRSGELERGAAEQPASRPFAEALRGETVAVIAEVKRRSPSKGDLDPGLAAGERAAAYAGGGAAAISVLTEPSRFGGSVDDLREVVSAVPVPVLRKDFIIHEVQILESRAIGASAVLLIARALAPALLVRLVRAARAHGVEPLVEVRTRDELARAVDSGADVIGVNARDLETLVIDEQVPLELLGCVPRDLVAVAESGIRDRAGVEVAARAGANAVLIGSALSVARNPRQAVSELTGVRRVQR